jgi:NADPH:quinone reductase-like Zn-dependent oxidoreductase
MAEYMVCDADSIMELPASLSFEQAAPLMCAGVSSRLYRKSLWLRDKCMLTITNRLLFGVG